MTTKRSVPTVKLNFLAVQTNQPSCSYCNASRIYVNTVNRHYNAHPRDRDLVSIIERVIIARVRNSGMQRKRFKNLIRVGALQVFT